MNSTKFQIEITEGKVLPFEDYPKDTISTLAMNFNIHESELENALISNDETKLICNEHQVELIISLLESINLSAEAKLAISKVPELDEDEALFGDIKIDSISFELDSNNIESSNNKINDIDENLIAEEQKISPKSIDKTVEKKTNYLSNILSFDESNDDNDETLFKESEEMQEEIPNDIPEEKLDLNFSQETQKTEVSKSEDIKQTANIIQSEFNPIVGEIFSEQINLPPTPPITQKIDENIKNNAHYKYASIGVIFITIIGLVIFQFNKPVSNIAAADTDQINSIIKKRSVSAPDNNPIKTSVEIKRSTFEGKLNLDNLEINAVFKTSDNNLSDLTFEIKNNKPTVTSEEEFITKKFIPKIISLRISTPSETSIKDTIEVSARITYRLGTNNMKAILPLYLKIEESNLILSSNIEISNDIINHLNLETKEGQNLPLIDLALKIPYKSINDLESNDRSISDLIDAQLSQHQNNLAKETKKDKKKKNPVD